MPPPPAAEPPAADPSGVLSGFSPATRSWFAGAFEAATPAQLGAWQAIADGDHSLVVAPTGSGKTLAAFLSALDGLIRQDPPEDPMQRCRVLYVSPLKALAADVQRNLRSPLAGLRQAAARRGEPIRDITVAMRSGDTSAQDRRQFARAPADILITTPESLFLLLTSRSREALRGVRTVIVDEVHAVCATKRGAHLAVSLERLDALLPAPAQRIGLSATVRPLEEVATFLGGAAPVRIVAPPASKTFDLSVVVPIEDMAAIGEAADDLSGAAAGPQSRASIWPHVEERVLDLIDAHRSTIVFANSRRLAERLTARLNELQAQRVAISGEPRDLAPPAKIMAQSGSGGGVEPTVARAHHGSVSREQRSQVEEDLKSGRLPAVVATSSLELGIDMGAVDLVVQVEAPPSVAAGLQRVGRAGHQVGAVSRGVIFPKYRGDLVECAVVAERMQQGAIEQLRYPRNPLDVLAQQIVAIAAMDEITVDEAEQLVRRAAPFAGLPRSALEATLDMLSGRYPSDEFAELRPRLVWDRVTGVLSPRPGAQRLAVTSGGTIPDRGMFGVFLASGEGPGRRVGELDEEMVYESRVGDVFLLGSTSWRIEDISHDRVLVSPAPGQIGRMPFWKGDSPGRPIELGRALGAFLRDLSTMDPAPAAQRAAAAGLDEWGSANLLAYLREQRDATGQLPSDRTLLVERFRDELGDWRLVVHSPFGAPVNAPWALAIGARLRERYGIDVASMHSDDGIVLRLPETEAEPPGADVAIFDPDEIESIVTDALGGSALFASRFRECAARSLLLPKRDPRRRAPLWQQRQRANQLLQVASQYGSFPVVLEAMRECLQDVFDVPGLTGLMRELQSRAVRVVEVETPAPSPFARSLLFGYVGMFLYEGDAPLAERRAQALSLDSELLAELLGSAELRELLDPQALADVEREIQRLDPARAARGPDAVHDLLRTVGDLTSGEAIERGAAAEDLEQLSASRRILQLRVGGQQRWIAIEDAGRMRDALGAALPVGVPEAFTEPVRDPVGDLVSRFARTHGPFVPAEPAARLGLGVSVVLGALERLRAAGRVAHGEFRPGGTGREWCDAGVLRTVRRRSLAALRKEVEPVEPTALARLAPAWQGVGVRSGPRGADGVLRVVEQLAGALLPASALETLILPSRIADYQPAMLDELTSAGDVVWCGSGSLGSSDGWIALAPADDADLLLPDELSFDEDPVRRAILDALEGGAALFARGLADRVRAAAGGHRRGSAGEGTEPHAQDRLIGEAELAAALWDLVWAGRVTNDSIAPLRALLGGSRAAPARARIVRRGRFGRAIPARYAPSAAASGHGGPAGAESWSGARAGGTSAARLLGSLSGRWTLAPAREADPTRRAHAAAAALLERHGVLTRAAAIAERVPGGFAAVYPVLKAAEESGRVRRGYFVEGLGAAQFAVSGAVERLRALASPDRGPSPAIALAACDPANPYGAALPWPDRPAAAALDAARPPQTSSNGAPTAAHGDSAPGRSSRGHQPGRKAGAVVVLVDGRLVLFIERGGRTILSYTDDAAVLGEAAQALTAAFRAGALGRIQVEKADGAPVSRTPLSDALESAGFRATPRGLRLRA